MRGKQRGFTLMEVLVVAAVGALLAGAVVPGIFNLFRGTARSNNNVVAIEDVESAAGWVLADGLNARTTNLLDGVPVVCQADVDCMTLNWTDYSNWGLDAQGEPTSHTVTYRLLSDGSFQRTYDGTSHIIARQITGLQFSYDDAARVITMTITSTSEEPPVRSETRSFLMHLRAVIQ